MAYLDTSVLGSYYCPESLSAAVNRALADLADAALSPLVPVEFSSLVALKVRTGELTRAAGRKVLAQFQLHLDEDYYRLLDLGSREYALACSWLRGFDVSLRTVDALHLACAFAHGQSLWTTDKALARVAAALEIDHRLISA